MATWVSAELPPDIPAACVVQAAEKYRMPLELLVSVLKQEGGKVGVAYPRKTGTYFGPAQISDKWLPHFKKWNVNQKLLQHDACVNVEAGAYILAYYKLREPNWERAIARYNVGSLKTASQLDAGARYLNKVMMHWGTIYKKWGQRGY